MDPTRTLEVALGILDLPTPVEVSGRTRAGLDYKIAGTVQQTLLIDLPAGRTVFSDAGGMSWMSATVQMNTQGQGGLGGMLKRAVSGATVFIVDFTAHGGPGHVAFSTDFPGKVLAFELTGGPGIIMHKHAFLCAEKTVQLDIAFTRLVMLIFKRASGRGVCCWMNRERLFNFGVVMMILVVMWLAVGRTRWSILFSGGVIFTWHMLIPLFPC